MQRVRRSGNISGIGRMHSIRPGPLYSIDWAAAFCVEFRPVISAHDVHTRARSYSKGHPRRHSSPAPPLNLINHPGYSAREKPRGGIQAGLPMRVSFQFSSRLIRAQATGWKRFFVNAGVNAEECKYFLNAAIISRVFGSLPTPLFAQTFLLFRVHGKYLIRLMDNGSDGATRWMNNLSALFLLCRGFACHLSFLLSQIY